MFFSLDFFLATYVAVLLALCIDQWIGEPPPRWHPVVWMGNYLNRAGRCLQKHIAPTSTGKNLQLSAPDWASFVRGAFAWWMGAVLVLLVSGALQWLLFQLPWGWAALLLGVVLKPMLAWRMLVDEVVAVDQQLEQSLQAGQQQLARIVSRDVSALDAIQVRESALESLSENLNDSMIAPLFWFALFGLPGAALYRFSDTADSMWGYRGTYRGQHWEWAGKWAARIDDVLAWVPARITAVALLIAGLGYKRFTGFPQQLVQLFRHAQRTPSPNSGWPMAALALTLNVRLSKPNAYTLHAEGNAAQSTHIAQAVRLANRAVLGLIALWCLLLVVFV